MKKKGDKPLSCKDMPDAETDPFIKKDRRRAMTEFASRAKSIIWRHDGKEKVTYEQWERRIAELQESSGYTKLQALVVATKELAGKVGQLRILFRNYDTQEYDPHPESHPEVHMAGINPDPMSDVVLENKELPYKDCVRWAARAAGAYKRTDKHPKTAPNDVAFYLYVQAINESKDFLGRLNAIEVKEDGDEARRDKIRKKGNRSIREITEMLDSLKEEKVEEDVPAGYESSEYEKDLNAKGLESRGQYIRRCVEESEDESDKVCDD